MEEEDLDSFVLGLRIVMEQQGLKPAPLSEEAGLGTSAIRDLFRKASSPKVSTAHAIAARLGISIDELIAIGERKRGGAADAAQVRAVSVPGRAGAGARIYLVDDYAKGGGLYRVVCPPQLTPRGIVAVEVSGDSMEPVYSEGDLLFYSRDVMGVPAEAVGRKCVCEDEEGRIWVKQVKADSEPGTFRLLSINPAGDNLFGVRLRWAAPVKFHLPRELVQRL